MNSFVKKFIWVNFSFSGRMNRYDLWIYGIIIFWIIGLSILMLSVVSIISFGHSELIGSLGGLMFSLVAIAYLIHIYATNVKRLHDHNRSGWNLLWTFIPLLGILALLIITIYCWFIKGTTGENKYGPDPTT